MSSRAALAQAVAILHEQEQADSTSQIDLCISIRVTDVVDRQYIESTDEELIEVGGTWNRRTKTWDPGYSDSLVIVRVPRGGEQEPAARYLAEWLRRTAIGPRGPHWDDFDRVWTAMLEGGRRAGKSHIACVILAMFAVMVPGALVWAVSPTNDETDELEGVIRKVLSGDWYTFRGGGGNRASQFKLANGARILLISGHKPRSLKRGGVELVLYNEGQNMSRAGWVQIRGAIGDTGGMVMIACNPPDTEIGRWIEELHIKIHKRMASRDRPTRETKAEKQMKGVAFKMTQATNPFVEHEALEDMAEENDDHTYRREVLGEFVPIGDVVMHAWSMEDSVIDDVPAHWIDVTPEETKRELGRAAGYVTGMDFQKTPHMPAGILRLFTDPTSEAPDEVIPVVLDEVVREDSNEDELLDGLEALPRWQRIVRSSGAVEVLRDPDDCYHGHERPRAPGYLPGEYERTHCAVVMDASGWWQDGEHHKGRTSDRKLRARNWVHLYKPQKDSDRNPEVLERCKVANARLKAADVRDAAGVIIKPGRRRMFVLAHCVKTIEAMRSWDNKHGTPNRKSKYAHICDAVTYPIFRFFGKVRAGAAMKYTPIGKFNRASEM